MKKRVPNQASKDSTSGAVVEPRIRSGSDFYRGRNRERLVFVGEVIAAVAGACLCVQETMIEEQQALLADLQETKGRARDLLLLRYAHDLKPRQSIF